MQPAEIKKTIEGIIKETLELLDWDLDNKEELYLDLPTGDFLNFGDLSSNVALKLSSRLKQSPLKIAPLIIDEIKKNLERKKIADFVREIRIQGAGFINFYLSDKFFCSQLADILARKNRFAETDFGQGRRVLVEFVSANPTGPLSVAHARQAVVGDVLANVLNLCGFKVKREYYLNDEGNQIDILGQSISLRIRELKGEHLEFPEDHYQGDYIYDIAREAEKAEIPPGQLNDFAIKYILKIIKEELVDFGVTFDCWYSQKELRKKGNIRKVLDLLEKKGYLYESDGALWFSSSRFGDDKDRVVVKSDSSYTYLAPDIAYHQDKYNRGFTWLINLWGPDHHGYVSRMKAAVVALGQNPDSFSAIIVQLASIFREGRPVQMSTRKGQYITLREILTDVSRDAARFFFLMRRTDSHLDFDLELAKKQAPDNPVYYVQYAHARICNILAKTKTRRDFRQADNFLLTEKEEQQLLRTLFRFSSYLEIVIKTLDPYILTVYLKDLATDFHRFYDSHRVLSENENLMLARLSLIEATRLVLAKGLELLGLSQPEKM